MSQAKVSIPMQIADDPDLTSDQLNLWLRLETLRMRQRSIHVQTGKNWSRITQLTGFYAPKIRRLIEQLTEMGYLLVGDDNVVTLLPHVEDEKEDGTSTLVSRSRKEPCPKPEPEPTTTSVDSEESPVEDDEPMDLPKLTSKDYDHLPIMRGALEKQEFADSVFDNWKAFAQWANSEGGFSRRVAAPRKSTQSIRRKILARFKDPPWQGDYWPPMLEKLKTLKPHWRGEGGWVIDLEYLVRNDGQAEKLLNGQWSEAAPKSTEVTQADIQEGLEAMKKMEEETPW